MIYLIIQLCLILFFPALAIYYQDKSKWSKLLSPIVLCYLLGLIIGNLAFFPVNHELAKSSTEISILIAIPLLLFATRLEDAFKFARPALASFALCIIAGLIMCCLGNLVFQNKIAEAWKVSGMLVGIYTGGTPNMQAIGLALKAPQEYIILLNAADILTGGIYLVLLTSILPEVLSKVLPSFKNNYTELLKSKSLEENGWHNIKEAKLKEILAPIGLSILILASSIGLSLLFFKNLENVGFIMLCLTSLSVLASFIPQVRAWKWSYYIGEYFLLIFCIALGMQAKFGDLAANGQSIIAFTTFALFGTILLHLVLAKIFRIDRDTFLISSTAALFGPAFIGQIASVIKNKTLIFPGIALGLLGYALGNYLGIGLANLLRILFTG